jgi:hypothetical protein
MVKHFKVRAFVWSCAGIITQIFGLAGIFSSRPSSGDLNPLWAGALLLLIGTGILCFGLYFYTQAKNRHAAFALVGLFSLAGFFFLHFLTDKCKPPAKRRKRS